MVKLKRASVWSRVTALPLALAVLVFLTLNPFRHSERAGDD